MSDMPKEILVHETDEVCVDTNDYLENAYHKYHHDDTVKALREENKAISGELTVAWMLGFHDRGNKIRALREALEKFIEIQKEHDVGFIGNDGGFYSCDFDFINKALGETNDKT